MSTSRFLEEKKNNGERNREKFGSECQQNRHATLETENVRN